MLLVLAFLVCLVAVPATGGSLLRLSDLQLRGKPVLFASLGVAVAVTTLFPEGDHRAHVVLNLATYGGAFIALWLNRRLRGLGLVGLGTAANVIAMSANGGIMPARPDALATAGLKAATGGFVNSTAVSHARVWFLGDVFASPRWVPFHNVYSVGDILIVLGALIAVLHVSGAWTPRLVPQAFEQVRRSGSFMRLWAAQGAARLAGWAFALAVTAMLAARHAPTAAYAAVALAQVVPPVLFGLVGGVLLDRLPRRRLLVACNIAQGAVLLALVAAPHPSMGQLLTATAVAALAGGLTEPVVLATVPELVPAEQLGAATSMWSLIANAGVLAGPLVGGFIAAELGPRVAFLMTALVLLAAATLTATVPFVEERPESDSTVADIVAGVRYAAGTPLVRSILVVLGIVMIGSAVRQPVEAPFVVEALHNGVAGIGVLISSSGLGLVLGSVAAPALLARWDRRRLLWIGLTVAGASIAGGSLAGSMRLVLVLWAIAGFGNAVVNISYETLLQEEVPHAFRGRVMAACNAVLDGGYLVGLGVASGVVAGTGIRGAVAWSGGLILLAAAVAAVLLRPGTALVRPGVVLEGSVADEPYPAVAGTVPDAGGADVTPAAEVVPVPGRQAVAETAPSWSVPCVQCGGQHVVASGAIAEVMRTGAAAMASVCTCRCCAWVVAALRAEVTRLRSIAIHGARPGPCRRCGLDHLRDWAGVEAMRARLAAGADVHPCQCGCCEWAGEAIDAELERLETKLHPSPPPGMERFDVAADLLATARG